MAEQQHKDVHAVDFDGTVAVYDHWRGAGHLGSPVAEMVRKIKAWRKAGEEVFIFTARVNPGDDSFEEGMNATMSYLSIAAWSKKNIGEILPITHEKSKRFTRIHDDRADEIIPNTGVSVTELMGATQ
jgi:hypothetical protein